MIFNINKEKIEERIIKHRRYLHTIPEVGLVLPKTIEYLKNQLEELNIKFEELKKVSGIVATIGGKKEGKVIGIRADMDALPILEETNLEFASTNGSMHACGHDGHMSILLAIEEVLKENEKELKGTVKLIFQPGEEGHGGAEKMLQEGVIEKHNIQYIVSHHIGSIFEEVDNGQLAVGYGVIMSCLDKFSLVIHGKGGHGGVPHKSIDPITMTAQIIQSIQCIVSREIDTNENGVISIGKIQAGSAHNIIPEKVELEGTVRTTSEEVRNYISRRIGEIAKGVTLAMNGRYDYNYHFGYPMVENNKDLVSKLIESSKKVISDEELVILKNPTMIGEDISYFLNKIPGVYFFLGSKKAVEGEFYPHHHCKFDIDEKELYKGVLVTVQMILDMME
ncbi:MAG TPA: amidohydrolase [Clostridium sp.]|nr:amidohydrolase [Clostridium sp.]